MPRLNTGSLKFSREQAARCEARNRYDSLKLGVSAVPVRLYPKPPNLPEGSEQITAAGRIPKTDEAALELINSHLSESDHLTLDDVHLLYPEAANNNFISDRYMHLGESSLKNMAKDAQAKIPFMNSHRTGSMSSDAELNYGTSFAGRYEHWRDGNGKDFKRAVMGVYMLKGTAPNGNSGPSTDDIARQIKGGVLNDVSVGFTAGGGTWYECDVCGENMDDYDLCPHVPGTHYKMDDDQVQAQKDRGVSNGYASYTLQDGHIGEVSAVYNGAVPGAGFKKAVRFSKKGLLGQPVLLEARESYKGLASARDFRPGGKETIKLSVFIQELSEHLGFGIENDLNTAPAAPAGTGADTEPPGDGDEEMAEKNATQTPPASPPANESAEALEIRKLREELAAERLKREQAEEAQRLKDEAAAEKAEKAKLAGFKKSAETFARAQLESKKVIPADAKDLAVGHYQAALDDDENPVEGFSRVEFVEKSFSRSKAHSLFENTGNDDVEVLKGERKANGHLKKGFFALEDEKGFEPTDNSAVEEEAEEQATVFAAKKNAVLRRNAASAMAKANGN